MNMFMLLTNTDAQETVKEVNQFIETMKGYIPKVIDFAINVIIAIIIFMIGKYVISLILKIFKRFFNKANIEISVSKFLLSLLRVIMYFILICIVCERVGIQTTSFLAVLGSAGLAIGLSMQGSLSNFAGGVMILLIKPFKVGDYIQDGGSGKEGTVNKIDLFYTHLITVDNKLIVVPNGTLANSHITNVTAFEKRRIDLNVGISYTSDITRAKKVMEDIVAKNDKILHEEEVMIFVKDLAASEVTLEMRVWAKTEDYWNTKFILIETIKNEFDSNGIEIPFNQLQVHISKES